MRFGTDYFSDRSGVIRMKFLYDKSAGNANLELTNEPFLHLKARRVQVGERISVRNLIDEKDYIYEILSFNRRSANLGLVFASKISPKNYDLTLGWAVVDPKIIEKTLPFLNELGVGKIAFVYTKFSQANFRLDIAKFERICALSCEQCGRGKLMEFEIYKSLDEFLKIYDNAAALNFGGENLQNHKDQTLIIGPEGGFSSDELAKFKRKFGLNTPNILRSQTAIIVAASKILL